MLQYDITQGGIANLQPVYQNLVTKSPRYTKSCNFFMKKKYNCYVRMLSPNKSCSKDNMDQVIDVQQYNPLIHISS